MATGMLGANTEELRSLGGLYIDRDAVVREAAHTVRQAIEDVDWLGADADAYRSNHGTAIPAMLGLLRGRLELDRGELERQAGEQDEASAGRGGREGCLKSIGDGIGKGIGAIFGGIGSFFSGAAIEGFWGDIKGMAALIGFDENWNWSLGTLADTWSGMAHLVGFNPNDGWSWSLGHAVETIKYVGKDLLAWDQWSTDPAGAGGRVLWNVGSMFIGVGEAGLAAKLGKGGALAADAGRLASVAGDSGRLLNAASDSGRLMDAAGDSGRLLDKAGDVGGSADNVAAAAGRNADELAVANRGLGADEIADLPKAERNIVNHGDWPNEPMRWNDTAGQSPDIVSGPRTDGATQWKLDLHQNAYDTGAHLDEAGNLVSTSGRTFTPEQVSHHYTSTTGAPDPNLMVGHAPEGMPFKPDHRYVLDSGKTVIETDSLGAPVYTRFHADVIAPDSGAYRSGGGISGGTKAGSDLWGPMNDGMQSPTRGHGAGAAFRSPFEDVNQIPQESFANSVLQNNIEGAMREARHNGTGGPFVVERRTDFATMQHPTDASRAITGPATRHEFTIFDADGSQWTPRNANGDRIPTVLLDQPKP